MASSTPTSENGSSQVSIETMTDAEFSEWCNPECFTPGGPNLDFDGAFPQMTPTDETVPWDSNWEEWLRFNDISKPTGEVELEDISPAIVEPPHEPADLLTPTGRVEVEDIPPAIAKPTQEAAEEIGPGLARVGSVVGEEVHKTENLLNLRRKLQKGLLAESGPNECQMSDMSSLLQQLEQQIEQIECITREDIRDAKIGTFLRKINLQNRIPREDEFQFKKRATILLLKWETIRKTKLLRVSRSASRCRAGSSTEPLAMDLTESYESDMSPEKPRRQASDNESISLTPDIDCGMGEPEAIDLEQPKPQVIDLEQAEPEVDLEQPEPEVMELERSTPEVIDLKRPPKPVVASEVSSSRAKEDSSQGCRATSLSMNDNKPVMKNVVRGNPSPETEPLSAERKRKRLPSEPRRSGRRKTSVRQYVASDEQFTSEAVEEIDGLIEEATAEIKRAESRRLSLMTLRARVLDRGAFEERVTNQWERSG